jgi:hypothetical protein
LLHDFSIGSQGLGRLDALRLFAIFEFFQRPDLTFAMHKGFQTDAFPRRGAGLVVAIVSIGSLCHISGKLASCVSNVGFRVVVFWLEPNTITITIANCDAATNTERKTINARTIGRVEGEKDRRQTLEHVRAMRDRATKVKNVLYFRWTETRQL